MVLLNWTSAFGVALIVYLSSFVLFAVLRIATGVSIQRIGYFSLRRISYTIKEGVRIDLRGLGVSLHRPTFSQPTWISLKFTELKVTVDPEAMSRGSAAHAKVETSQHRAAAPNTSGLKNDLQDGEVTDDTPTNGTAHRTKHGKPRQRSQLWKKLTGIKEKIKRLHRQIHYLAMVDVVATNTVVDIRDVAQLQIASFTMAVDTRQKMVARGRLFRHKKDPAGGQRPAEWIFTVRGVLLSVGDRESAEILDILGVNVHGILYTDREGLRDTSISLKMGRLHIPCESLLAISHQMKAKSQPPHSPVEEVEEEDVSFAEVVEELDKPGTREEKIVQTVADSKEFVSSLLRGVQEIQVALSFFRVSWELHLLPHAGRPIALNVVTHEVGIDLHRLDPRSPAHRMYFTPQDVAHQALVAAISISLSIDDSEGEANKLIYIPMATTTIKTTLPSKTVTFSEDRDADERNTNVLFANLVVTSPSLDLEPKHVAQLQAISQSRKGRSTTSVAKEHHRLIPRLLPKVNIKLSVHEPVVRFVLPITNPIYKKRDDYDLLISSISSISLDVESSHSAVGELHYSLVGNYRVASHLLYYQTAEGVRHNLLVTESLEMKVQLSATPDVFVILSGNLRTFSIHMVREEVSLGLYNLVKQFQSTVKPDKLRTTHDVPSNSFLRRLPPWLLEFHFEGTDFGIEIAGVDPDISKNARGVALQLESWTAEYRSHKHEAVRRGSYSRRRTTSSSAQPDVPLLKVSPPASHKKQGQGFADGRRLALHVRGFEGFIVENADVWEPDPFLSIPRVEVAFSTSSDLQGPVFHINSVIKSLFIHFSLFRYYSLGVAGMVVKEAFLGPPGHKKPPRAGSAGNPELQADENESAHHRQVSSHGELVTVDLKASLIQLKGKMPADPPMLLQFYDLAAGRHRWSAPFLRCHLARLHVEAPKLRGVWARIVSMNSIRVDLRDNRKKVGTTLVDEKSIDVATDFIRLAVPYQLTLYKVFDNIVNTNKAMEQLHHRFKTRTNEYVLEKFPEGPKKVPRISLRSKALMFELEDDPFEWKLGTIYHIGLVEQKQRLAREAAYRVKTKRLEEGQRGSSRYRTQPSQPVGKAHSNHSKARRSVEFIRHRSRSRSRSRSHSPNDTRHSPSPTRGRRSKRMRYNPEGVCALTNSAKVSNEDAWYKLQQVNARSWKRRIDAAMRFQSTSVKEIRRLFSGADEPPDELDSGEAVMAIPARPGLMATIISDLHLVIDKPSFPVAEYPKYLHRIGKGMPFDMQYSLLIPMSLTLDMGEARITLRDYPMNLLHVPAIRPGQSPRLPSWSLRTDFVIAEEYRDWQSLRHVKVDVIPSGQDAAGLINQGFAIDVKRTVAPVKMYTDMAIDINTSAPTSFSWGTSYSPVIQDMMMVIDGFTKPEVDLSDRVGFWDKIRLSLHSRLTINWKGDGDVHFRLKGSRDPYVITGYGAGFVMCWRKNVQLGIHTSDDPKKFLTITSDEYVLAIPDYSHSQLQASENPERDNGSVSTSSSLRNAAVFKKVIMKLAGNVQWSAGLVFEQEGANRERLFDFRPHYTVVLKNPLYQTEEEKMDYDAFRGFRSHHIHLSIAVAAPVNRDWSFGNRKASSSYNTVHLTPRFFTHFFSWWQLFSGVMSLPVRQGRLWPGQEKKSKKFGRHLATIKYNLLLSPLFIAHIYKHKDAEDYNEDVVSATGLKLRLDSFMLDLHQRREEFDTIVKGKSTQTRTSGMKMNQAQLDFISADVRAVSANIGGTNPDDLVRASDEILSSYQQPVPTVDMSRFTIPDHDLSWIDMDDFVELDWILPSESNPETHILPLAFMPRFTYFRQTDHTHSISGDETRTSIFGDEPTHFCVMSHDNDPRRVQMDLVRERLAHLEKQIKAHQLIVGDQELHVIRDSTQDPAQKERFDELTQQKEELQAKKEFLEGGLKRLARQFTAEDPPPDYDRGNDESVASSESGAASDASPQGEMDGLYSNPNDEFSSDFNNRFIVHNLQLKWNNALRNIILRYSHQVSQRRGFVYYMSRRAIKFILDIVDEQAKSKQQSRPSANGKRPSPPRSTPASPGSTQDNDVSVEARIEQLLNDAKRFVDADDPVASEGPQRQNTTDFGEKIAEEFMPQNSYHIRLIAPQIQLQSDKNARSIVLVAAKGMQLKVVSIMDKARVSDDVSGLVQRRFSLDMDGAQFFVTTQKRLFKYLHLYSGNKYGNAPGSAWPPWVSIEVMFDFKLNPFGFQRVIQKTSASLRYEKYNTLRLKYNEQVASGENGDVHHPHGTEQRIDHLWVEFPTVKAICDSLQYYSMYIIVMDLLLYSEPLEKIRSERLEKIMLASDFSDLRGAPEMATQLQERIRQLEEIKSHFQVNAKYLDRQGWQDRINLEKDIANCEDELFFIMKAITTSQQKKSDDRTASEPNGLLRWYLSASEIVWHLMRDKNDPLLEFQLGNAAYERTDNSDGSNHNAMEIEQIRGLNLLSNALYPEMIAPYVDHSKKVQQNYDDKMLKVHWYMLEAIAGIPVLEQFEVSLFPMSVQLEHELGTKLFEYIFPGKGHNGERSPFQLKQMQPVGEDEESELEEGQDTFDVDEQNGRISNEDIVASTRPGAMELRLKPTLALHHGDRSGSRSTTPSKGLGITSAPKEQQHHRFGIFGHNNKSNSTTARPASMGQSTRNTSTESFKMTVRQPTERSMTSMTSLSTTNNSGEEKEKPKRFTLHRTMSKEHHHDRDKASDDLTQMMSRASNYMTLAHVKINSVVLCLSYKGKGERNIEDVHNFVFRMPVLEYRNKTWSNLDLALRLKKDVIKALISHTGAIIGNKFHHHRPNKQQLNRLREAANSSQILPSAETLSNAASDSVSLYNGSTSNGEPRQSFTLGPSPLMRTTSFASSIKSSTTTTASIHNPSRISSQEAPPAAAELGPRESAHSGTGNILPAAFTRRFTADSTKSHQTSRREGTPEKDGNNSNDNDPDNHKRKSMMLLGKKILGR